MMQVLHVTFMFPTQARPLEGVAVENIVKSIRKAIPGSKHTILQLSRDVPEDMDGTQEKDYVYYNIHLPSGFKFWQFYSMNKIKHLLENNSFDLIYFHNIFPGLLLLHPYLEKHKTPYIITFRGSCDRAVKYIYRRKLLNNLIKNAFAYTFLSEFYFESITVRLKKQGTVLEPGKIHFIPNFKQEIWAQGVTEVKLSNPVKILALASIEKRKNLQNTLKAIHLLFDKYDIEFSLYGEIYDMDVFNSIQPLLNNKIRYFHPKLNEDIMQVIDDSHILVLASLAETFGMAYIESILRHRPIIYAENAGITGFIKDISCGEAVRDVTRPEVIAAAIEKCIGHYNEYSFAGSERFLQANVIRKWAEIYHSAIEKSRA